MGARLAALVKKGDKENPLIRVRPGVFALREWNQKMIEQGLADRTPALEILAANGGDAELLEVARAEAGSNGGSGLVDIEDEEALAPDDEEVERLELAASATGIFEPEEDDDEPIFGEALAEEDDDEGREGEKTDQGGSRRRRRRRRRGRAGPDEPRSGEDLPTYTVTDAPAEPREATESEPRPEPRVETPKPDHRSRERNRESGPQAAVEELVGRDLADAIASLMATYDRNAGLVSSHKLADAFQRKGRVSSDAGHVQGLILAAARADNARRALDGLRPRFRLAGNRMGLTDWLMDDELGRLERDLLGIAERYREAVRRSLLRRLQQLPHRAIGELVVLLLERLGMGGLVPVRRAGAPGSELHLAGNSNGATADVRVAVVVRRDGREVGRERVAELRGALHHYGPAVAGWIVTTGQVLSGAREEAAAPGAAPITLVDGNRLVRLCEEHGVAVQETRLTLPLPDLDLLDALRTG
jgi:hypothetical protein